MQTKTKAKKSPQKKSPVSFEDVTPFSLGESVSFSGLIQSAVAEHDRVVTSFQQENEQLKNEAKRLRQEIEESRGRQVDQSEWASPLQDFSDECQQPGQITHDPPLPVSAPKEMMAATASMGSVRSAFSSDSPREESIDQKFNTIPQSRCSCSYVFKEVDRFCRGCGTERRIVLDRCFCGNKLGDDAQFCSKCGKARRIGRGITSDRAPQEDGEDTGLELHSWLRQSTIQLQKSGSIIRSKAKRQESSLSVGVPTTKKSRLLDRLVHQPINPARVWFDIFGAALIVYDAFILPLKAFEYDESVYTRFMQNTCFHYWNLNLFSSFFLSYAENGIVVTEALWTARHYLRTWFVLDTMVMLPDWLTVFADDTEDVGLTKLFRVVRLLRLVRMIRLFKLFSILARVGDIIQINSELVNIFVSVVKSVLTLLVINHFIACAWYFCARDQKGRRPTWLAFHGFENDHWFYVYTVSLHWSLTQFTPASMHVQPQNVIERIFTVIVVIFAMVFFSYVLGGVSSSMAQLRKLNEDAVKNFWHIRRFMRQHNVPVDLSIRIQKYLETKFGQKQKKLQVSDVPLFNILSQQLKNELEIACIGKYLEYHPLLEYLWEDSDFLGKLAEKSITEQHFATDDCVFFQGEPASCMYFVAEGSLEYSKMRGENEVVTDEVYEDERAWIAEAALWVSGWQYRGCAIVTSDSAMIKLDARGFAETCQNHSERPAFIRKYAEVFITMMRTEVMDTDIFGKGPGTSIIDDFFIKAKQNNARRSHGISFGNLLGRVSMGFVTKPFHTSNEVVPA